MSWIRRTSALLMIVGLVLPLVAQELPDDAPPESPGWGVPPDDPAGRGGPPEADFGEPDWASSPDAPAGRGEPPEVDLGGPGRGGPPDDPAGRGGPPEAGRGGGAGPGRGSRGGEPPPGGPIMEIRSALGVSDEEWTVLLPRIQAVQAAQKEVEHAGRGGRGPGRGGPDPNGPDRGATIQNVPTPVQEAQTTLQRALARQNTTVSEYLSAMAAMRSARQKSADALLKAQNELIPLLTVRQEAILMQFGFL
jgi:hypothetical protein